MMSTAPESHHPDKASSKKTNPSFVQKPGQAQQIHSNNKTTHQKSPARMKRAEGMQTARARKKFASEDSSQSQRSSSDYGSFCGEATSKNYSVKESYSDSVKCRDDKVSSKPHLKTKHCYDDSKLTAVSLNTQSQPALPKVKKHRRRKGKMSDKDKNPHGQRAKFNDNSCDGADCEMFKSSVSVCCDKDWKEEDACKPKEDQNGQEVCKTDEDSHVDPLRVDMYDRLRAEKREEESKDPWENFVVCDDLQKACNKFSCTEKQFYVVLMTVFVAMTFAMVFGLIILQSQISMASHQMLNKVQAPRKEALESKYDLYFNYLLYPWPEKVDLRVNTTIFVH